MFVCLATFVLSHIKIALLIQHTNGEGGRSLNICVITNRLQFNVKGRESAGGDWDQIETHGGEDFFIAGGGSSCSRCQDPTLEDCRKGSSFEGGVQSVLLRQVRILKIERTRGTAFPVLDRHRQKRGPNFELLAVVPEFIFTAKVAGTKLFALTVFPGFVFTVKVGCSV